MVSKVTIVAPLGVATQEDKIMYLSKQPNKTQPLQYMLCTHIRKGKDYPYNSEKRGWILEKL